MKREHDDDDDENEEGLLCMSERFLGHSFLALSLCFLFLFLTQPSQAKRSLVKAREVKASSLFRGERLEKGFDWFGFRFPFPVKLYTFPV